MKYEDLIAIATNHAADYINSGWWFNPGTMSGSQSDIAFVVTLTDGKDTVAIFIETKYGMTEPGYFDKYTIRERVFKGVKFTGNDSRVIWFSSDPAEEVYSRDFYRVGKDWFVDFDEAKRINNIKSCRIYDRTCGFRTYKIFRSENAKKLAKKILSGIPGYKRVREDDIECLRKEANGTWKVIGWKKDDRFILRLSF